MELWESLILLGRLLNTTLEGLSSPMPGSCFSFYIVRKPPWAAGRKLPFQATSIPTPSKAWPQVWCMRVSSSASSSTGTEKWHDLTSPPVPARLWPVRIRRLWGWVPSLGRCPRCSDMGSSQTDLSFSAASFCERCLHFLFDILRAPRGWVSLLAAQTACVPLLSRQHSDRRDRALLARGGHFRVCHWNHSQQLCGLLGLSFRHRVGIPGGVWAERGGRWATVPWWVERVAGSA